MGSTREAPETPSIKTHMKHNKAVLARNNICCKNKLGRPVQYHITEDLREIEVIPSYVKWVCLP